MPESLPPMPAAAKPALPIAPIVPLGDVPALLSGSRPRPVIRQAGRALMAIWIAAVVGPLFGLNAGALEAAALLATLGGSVYLSLLGAGLRKETATLDRLEGLLAMRRTDDVVPALHRLMARPMRVPENRLRAMLMLGGVLARLDRHDDALAVFNELIDAEGLAGPGGAVVKIARATEMLRADHLYDADRAINDLRRLLDRGGVAAEMAKFETGLNAKPDPAALAGLRLLELHRDVKTGHNVEAVDHFTAELPELRKGLGHRVADAHALIAIAAHRLNRAADAEARFADATALAPLSELVRRYPDLWPLCSVYSPTQLPR